MLANVADPTPAVVAVVRRYLIHPNALLRAHAVWAARQLGIDLPAGIAHDPDERVRIEAAQA